ncbi:threonine--tRNA ligase [Candidatus Roizmanbacteria bacterium RIFCSPHIGHO2_02_FULL_37_15]|nr:MAG: threonine--tRNA ligase [Candidatus Roizmanbacteria bacterium RIFCSPHIGHO2_02_FULL_37_15]
MDKQREYLNNLRHSCAHLLAAAVIELWPDTKRAIGPAIENGFYFDFEFKNPISESDFPKIEQKMHEIVTRWKSFERHELTKEQAKKQYPNNPFKQELIDEFSQKGEKLIFYKSGDYWDLCRGGHIDHPAGGLKHFKLLSIAGAYWRGDEKNKMLTRIYGTCFPTKEELDKYLWQQEEAKKRDHRKLGKILDLWTFSDLVGSGLPLFTPKGALVRNLINKFVEDLQVKQGINQVWTPQFNKAELFKLSGHYDKYRENMFKVHSNYSKEEFYLKPMNCPQHTQIYASKPRSYKDLPIRLADFAMLYRDEKPGELLGLVRSRSFSQDDCHIFCREDQVVEEMNKALDMTKQIMDAFGFAYKYRLSVRDPHHSEKYIGDENTWKKSEKISEEILKNRKIEYFVGLGEAAFYAPKLDLIAKDSLDREWQLSTLQIDYFMPRRFKLSYVDDKGKEQTPVMLHRAILGSSERLMGILLEHHAGAFPLWLSPIQVAVLPISVKQINYSQKIKDILENYDIRSELYSENKTINAKIREATLQKIPYMAIIGDKEASKSNISNLLLEKTVFVSVRTREGKDLRMISLEKFIKILKDQIKNFS